MTEKQKKFRQDLLDRWGMPELDEMADDIKKSVIKSRIITHTKELPDYITDRIVKSVMMLHDTETPHSKQCAWLGGYLYGISERISCISPKDIDVVYNLFETKEI